MDSLRELVDKLREEDQLELANKLSIALYKANMWDKYNEEGRIRDPFESEITNLTNLAQLAAESGGGGKEEITMEELWEWCTDYDPDAEREDDNAK